MPARERGHPTRRGLRGERTEGKGRDRRRRGARQHRCGDCGSPRRRGHGRRGRDLNEAAARSFVDAIRASAVGLIARSFDITERRRTSGSSTSPSGIRQGRWPFNVAADLSATWAETAMISIPLEDGGTPSTSHSPATLGVPLSPHVDCLLRRSAHPRDAGGGERDRDVMMREMHGSSPTLEDGARCSSMESDARGPLLSLWSRMRGQNAVLRQRRRCRRRSPLSPRCALTT